MSDTDRLRAAAMSDAMFVRTNGGWTIHLATCRYAAAGLPWLWAGDDVDRVNLACYEFGYHLCKVCNPLGGVGDTR